MRRRSRTWAAVGMAAMGLTAVMALPAVGAPTPKPPKLTVTVVDSKAPGECVIKVSATSFDQLTDDGYLYPYTVQVKTGTGTLVQGTGVFEVDGRGTYTGTQVFSWPASVSLDAPLVATAHQYGADVAYATDLVVPNRCNP